MKGSKGEAWGWPFYSTETDVLYGQPLAPNQFIAEKYLLIKKATGDCHG